MTGSVRSRLPKLSAGEALLLSRLAEMHEHGVLTPTRRPSPAWVVLTAEPGGWEVFVAPVSAGGQPLRLTSDDGHADALQAALGLEAVEPIFAALENAWQVTLRPVCVTGEAPAGPVVRIERPECLALLSLKAGEDLEIIADSARPSPARLTGFPVATEYRVSGPVVPIQRLRNLAPGDLLLVSAEAAGRFAAGGSDWAGHIDLRTRTFTLSNSGSLHMTPTDDGWAAARSPVELVIDGGSVPIGKLAALAPGSVLTLDLQGDVVPVELRAAGVRIGRGELVAVGDAFGVLLTSVNVPTDAEQGEEPAASPEPLDA